MLSVAIAYFIHLTGIGLHWSFLIVFFLYVLLAALLGFLGYRKVKQVKAPGAGHRAGQGDPPGAEGPGLACSSRR